MILLYPVGIPVLFSVLLLKRRDKINPSLPAVKLPCPWGAAAKSNQIRGRSSRPVDERGRDDPEAAWAVAGTKGVSAALDEGCPSGSVGAEGGRRGRRKGMGDGGWDTAAAPAVTVAAGVGATVSFEEVIIILAICLGVIFGQLFSCVVVSPMIGNVMSHQMSCIRGKCVHAYIYIMQRSLRKKNTRLWGDSRMTA